MLPSGQQELRNIGGFHQLSRPDAGVELARLDYEVRAAGRGVDAQISNADTGESARRREHFTG